MSSRTAHLAAARIGGYRGTPLFRTLDRRWRLTDSRIGRREVLAMVKLRAAAGLPLAVCSHSFQATGITAYLLNCGTWRRPNQIAANESPQTTKLYDCTSDEVSLDEIETVLI